MLKRVCIWSFVLAAIVFCLAAPVESRADQEDNCRPADGLAFICGLHHPEDLVLVLGSKWIIAGSLSLKQGFGAGGGLYLIDSEARIASKLIPEFSAAAIDPHYNRCPGPPDARLFGAHGLAISPLHGSKYRLYAINHGGREAVEVFDIDMKGGRTPIWRGCVEFPSNFFLNSVAPTSDGGLVVTNLLDRSDGDRRRKMVTAGNTGAVYRWRPGETPQLVAGSELTGDNGIAVSADGAIYVAAWGGKAIVRLTWHNGVLEKKVIPLDFLPDNLHWAPDGTLLIAGQRRDMERLFEACTPEPCRIAWVVARLDPRAMTVRELKSGDGQSFTEATTALQVGHQIWLGSADDDRIAIMPLDE
jgi:sugar lactone lactonase YvrE